VAAPITRQTAASSQRGASKEYERLEASVSGIGGDMVLRLLPACLSHRAPGSVIGKSAPLQLFPSGVRDLEATGGKTADWMLLPEHVSEQQAQPRTDKLVAAGSVIVLAPKDA